MDPNAHRRWCVIPLPSALTITRTKPSEACQHCRSGLGRTVETYYNEVADRRVMKFVHLKPGGGFVDCEDQTLIARDHDGR